MASSTSIKNLSGYQNAVKIPEKQIAGIWHIPDAAVRKEKDNYICVKCSCRVAGPLGSVQS